MRVNMVVWEVIRPYDLGQLLVVNQGFDFGVLLGVYEGDQKAVGTSYDGLGGCVKLMTGV